MNHLTEIDDFIFGCGLICVGTHGYYIWGAHLLLQKQHAQEILLACCEFFPLLGLTGTVVSLLNTLFSIEGENIKIAALVQEFAPALTTTVSGLLCMMICLLCNMGLVSSIHHIKED